MHHPWILSIAAVVGAFAPSALHAPAAVLWFMLKQMVRGRRLGQQRINNLRGSVLSTLVGMNRFKFGYYLVSATRTSGPAASVGHAAVAAESQP